MPSPDDQQRPDDEKGLNEPVSPYKYTTPEKAAASIEVRKNVLKLFGYTPKPHAEEKPAESDKTPPEPDASYSIEEQTRLVHEAREKYDELCARYGVFGEQVRLRDPGLLFLSSIPAFENNEGHYINEIEELFRKRLTPELRATVLERLKAKGIAIPKLWLPLVLQEDRELGSAELERLVKKKRIGPEEAVGILHRAGSHSYELSQWLLRRFPKILEPAMRDKRWQYDLSALAELPPEKQLDVLRHEIQKYSYFTGKSSPWYDGFSDPDVKGPLLNSLIATLRENPGADDPQSIAKALNLRHRKNPVYDPLLSAVENEAIARIEDGYWVRDNPKKIVPLEEAFPELPRVIAKLRNTPGLNEQGIYGFLHDFSNSYRPMLEESPIGGTREEMNAHLIREQEKRGVEDPQGLASFGMPYGIFYHALTNEPLTLREIFLNSASHSVEDHSLKATAAYIESLEAPVQERHDILRSAATELKASRNVFASGRFEWLSDGMTDAERIDILKLIIARHAGEDNAYGNGLFLSKVLAELAKISISEAGTAARALSTLPIGEHANLQCTFFEEAYDKVFTYERRRKKGDSAPTQKLIFPAVRIMKKAMLGAEESREKDVPLVDADLLLDRFIAATIRSERLFREYEEGPSMLGWMRSIAERLLTFKKEKNGEKETARPERILALSSATTLDPQVGKLEDFPPYFGKLGWPPYGGNGYLVDGYIDREEGAGYVQHAMSGGDALSALTTLRAGDAKKDDSPATFLQLYEVFPDTLLPLPIGSTFLRATDGNGRAVRVKKEPDGRVRITGKTMIQNLRIDLRLGTGRSMDVPTDIDATALRASLPSSFERFAVPHLRRDVLPEPLQEAIERATNVPVNQAAETLVAAVKAYLAYDDTVQEEYENIEEIVTDEHGRHAYIERILSVKKGVCQQHSRLLSELMRHAGIPCIETTVLWAQKEDVSQNDRHILPMIPFPAGDGTVQPILVEATGSERILKQLYRAFCKIIDVAPPSMAIAASRDDDLMENEQVIAPAAWLGMVPNALPNVSIPTHATESNVRAVARELGIEQRESLAAMVQAMEMTCLRNPTLFKNSDADARGEILRYCLDVRNAMEDHFRTQMGGSLNDIFANPNED